MKPTFKEPGTKRLKDKLLTILLPFCFNFAFNFNLCHYSVVQIQGDITSIAKVGRCSNR